MRRAINSVFYQIEENVNRIFDYAEFDRDDKQYLLSNVDALRSLDTYAFSLSCMDLLSESDYRDLSKNIDDLIEVINAYIEKKGV